MPKYSLTGIDKKYLTLEMDNGKAYSLPLAGTMKIKELRKLIHIGDLNEVEQFDLQVDFLAKYMGEAVVGDMSQDEVNAVYQAWLKASNGTLKEDGGPGLGESSASED